MWCMLTASLWVVEVYSADNPTDKANIQTYRENTRAHTHNTQRDETRIKCIQKERGKRVGGISDEPDLKQSEWSIDSQGSERCPRMVYGSDQRGQEVENREREGERCSWAHVAQNENRVRENVIIFDRKNIVYELGLISALLRRLTCQNDDDNGCKS